MASRKNLLNVDYHYDTDTGMYEVGEIDFGISSELDNYAKRYGREGIKNILLTLAHLTWHVQQYGYPLAEEDEQAGQSQISKV